MAFSNNRPPPPQERYWRVLVHPIFNGNTWERDPRAETRRPPEPVPAPASLQGRDQIWLVEPSRFTAVPWNSQSLPVDPSLRLEADGELRLLRPALERRSYRLLEQPQPLEWQRQPPSWGDLALPAESNPRLLALGRSWAALPDMSARVMAARAFFQSQGFRYTTTPGTLPERNGLDVFLFERRLGFCGHYASAFSALMRAAGVPSRVVSGYLGGSWIEPFNGSSYLELRQSNAHAWSEVWLPGVGWQRVDPTRWVSGASAADEQRTAGLDAAGWPLARQFRWLQRQWWGLDMGWSRWWLGFDRSRQEELLQWLLGERRRALGWLLLAAVAACLGAALLLLRLQKREPRDRLERELRALLQALERLQITTEPGETMESLTERAASAFPALAEPLAELAALHREQRYAPGGESAQRGRRARQRWQLALQQVKRHRINAISRWSGSNR